MSATLLRFARLLLYLAITLPLMPLQAVFVLAGSRLARRLPRLYHGWTTRLLGFQVAVSGEISPREPTLFVANHVSFLDIEILGSLLEASFIAKADVARWPLFGWLAKLQRTVFVDRRVRSTALQRDSIMARLAAGDALILFPEGTSSDGNRVLPFKSALFSAAEAMQQIDPIVVQPVSIAYTRLDGIPLGRLFRPYFAWYGSAELTPHLWNMIGLGTVEVVVEFHQPTGFADCGSRKALARYCHARVAGGVAAALSGRPQPVPVPPRAAPAPSAGAVEPAPR